MPVACVRHDLVCLLVGDFDGALVDRRRLFFRFGQHLFAAALHLFDLFIEVCVLLFDLLYLFLPLLDHLFDGAEQQEIQPDRQHDQIEQMKNDALPCNAQRIEDRSPAFSQQTAYGKSEIHFTPLL